MSDEEFNKQFAKQESETLKGALVISVYLCITIILLVLVGGM